MPRTHTSAPAFVQRTSILHRITMQAVIMATFIIVILSTVSFVIARTMLEHAVLTQLSSVASATQNSVEQSLQSADERAALLASSSDIQNLLTRDAADAAAAQRLFGVQQREQRALAGIAIYDAQGRLLSQAGDVSGIIPDAHAIPFHRPVIEQDAWKWYDVFTPVWNDHAQKIGYVTLRYDAVSFLEPILALDSSIGNSETLEFAFTQSGSLVLIHPSDTPAQSYVLYLKESDPAVQKLPLTLGVEGNDGMGRSQDERGTDVLAAYGSLSSLGWGMSVQVDRSEALRQIQSLAFSHAMLGVLLVLLAFFLAYLLSNQLTQPLRVLTKRVASLRPGHWQLSRSVHSGDEVEVLDRVMTDLAVRLRDVYKNQEDEIEARTADLKKQYTLDRAILDGIEQGVVTVDRKGLVTGINPAAQRMLQVTEKDALGSTGTTIIDLRGHQGSVLKIAHPLAECLEKSRETRSPANAHWSIMRHDGTMVPVIMAVSPLLEDKESFGAIVVMQDITEERRLDYLKSEFITLASHQLRTPLSAIRWYVELFQEEQKSLTSTQKSYLHEIDHGLKRMLALLTALLNASRLEGENLKMDVKEIDASQLLHEMNQDCQSLAAEAGQTCRLGSVHGKIMLQSDETLLRIVLQNLISNAVKYSAKGKTIDLGLGEKNGKAVFTVTDHGLGIPKEEQQRVFQRFFRAKNVRAMDTDGNGLGLYITKSIVESLGGTIAFESKENEGTTFTVTFPLKMKRGTKKA
ncbi:MAG TPA: ATP-binding protein [Candidatus Peribacteraceae bacterium]|nr:ATP-binding protein [Candidatus Peribacteraceae bacterium]